jgi:hypothetical protein
LRNAASLRLLVVAGEHRQHEDERGDQEDASACQNPAQAGTPRGRLEVGERVF